METQKSAQMINLGRFAALAFCRADILLQVSTNLAVKFCTGSALTVFGKKDSELIESNFPDLIHPDDQATVQAMFGFGTQDARIEDLLVRAQTSKKVEPQISISGYRVPDFENDFFLAIKVATKKNNSNWSQP